MAILQESYIFVKLKVTNCNQRFLPILSVFLVILSIDLTSKGNKCVIFCGILHNFLNEFIVTNFIYFYYNHISIL